MNSRDRNALIISAVATAAIGGLGWLLARQATEPGEVAPVRSGEAFPAIRGTLLSGQPLTIPDDLAGKVAVLVLGWEYAARGEVAAWGTHLMQRFDAERPDFAWLEMAMISGIGPMMRRVIDQAMVRNTPATEHSHVLTVYGDLRRLCKQLQGGDRHAQVFILGRTGRIAWQTTGASNPDDLAALDDALGMHGVA